MVIALGWEGRGMENGFEMVCMTELCLLSGCGGLLRGEWHGGLEW